MQSAAESPKSSKLESLSKDDLIKFAKKQLFLLQKSRAKIEELMTSEKVDQVTSAEYSSCQQKLTATKDAFQLATKNLDAAEMEKKSAAEALKKEQEQREKDYLIIAELQAELSEMKKSRSNDQQPNESENQHLAQEIKILQQKQAEDQRINEKLQHNFKVLKQRYLTVNKELESLKQKNNANETDHEESSQLSDLKYTLSKEREEANVMKERISQLSEDRRELTTAVEQLTAMTDTLKIQLQQVEDVKSASESVEQAEIKTLQAQCHALTQELDALKEQHKKSTVRAEELVLGLGKESAQAIAAGEEKMIKLEREIEKVKTEMSELQASLESMTLEKQTLGETVEHLKSEIDTSTCRVQSLEDELTQSLTQTTSANETIRELNCQMDELKTAKQELLLTVQENTTPDVSKDLESMKQSVLNLEQQLETKECYFIQNEAAMKEQHNADLVKCDEKIQAGDLLIDRLRQELNGKEELITQNKSLSNENSVLTEKIEMLLQQVRTTTEEDNSESQQLLAELSARKDEIVSFEKSLEEQKEMMEQAKSEYQGILAEKQNEVNRLTDVAAQLRNDHDIVTTRLSETETSYDKQVKLLNEELLTLQSANQELQEELNQAKEQFNDQSASLTEELAAITENMSQARIQSQEQAHLYQTKIAELNMTIDELSAQNQELITHRDTVKAANIDLTNQVEVISEKLAKSACDKDQQIEELQGTILNLTDQLQLHKTEAAELRMNTDELFAQKQEITAEGENIKAANVNLANQVELLTEQITNLASDKNHEIEALEATASDLRMQLNEFTETSEALAKSNLILQKVEKERDELTEQVSSLHRELESVRKEAMDTSVSSQTSVRSEEAAHDERIKELEEKSIKFKMVALKAKKELVESRKTVEKLTAELQSKTSAVKLEEAQTVIQNYQMLQQNLDSLHDDLDNSHSQVAALEEELRVEKVKCQSSVTSYEQMKADCEELKVVYAQSLETVSTLESKQKDVTNKLISLEQERDSKQIQVDHLKSQIQQAQDDFVAKAAGFKATEVKLNEKISQLQVKVQEARDELELAYKGVTKTSLMDLEIADFEKTVQRLQNEVTSKQEEITSVRAEFSHLEQKNASLEAQMSTADEQRLAAEERNEKLKEMLVKVKEELGDARQQESNQKSSDAAVRGELEALRFEHESLKVQLSQNMSSKSSAEEKVRNAHETNSRLVRTMENKQRSLQADLDRSESQLIALQQEYDGYKVRVHSVLKQQQTRAKVEAALENEKVEREHVEEVLDHVKTKLQETSEKLTASLAENGLLQDELDKLSLKHNKLTQDTANKETTWRQRVDQLMLENSAIATENTAHLQQMSDRNELVTNALREQISASQSEYQSLVSSLRNEMMTMENEKSVLQNDLLMLRQQTARDSANTSSSNNKRPSRSVQPDTSLPDPRLSIRESGEGMEHPDSATTQDIGNHKSSASIPLVGLEKLLLQDADDAMSVRSSIGGTTDGTEEDQLRTRLASSEKTLEHLRTLLNDSEATCTCYVEQVKILKAEIRRLESNQLRETSISNMEYLKNVIYKFVSLQAGDERMQLLPVLETMLKFTPEEKKTLKQIAQGIDGAGETASESSSWGGYLHRWTGFSS